jgi:HEXXH motif-containing protein
VSWIHVTLGRGSGADGAMRLAEHLLHEGTHQRVHDLELLAPIASGGDEGPRFYSPWRRQWRPLRGLLHGACTFSVGAAYFERTLHAYEEGRVPVWPQRGLWLARRFLEEMESVRVALRHLRGAEGEGLLPVGGRRLLAAVAREHAALRRATRRRRAQLAATEEGRKQLEGVEAHARQLRSEPVRWDLD